ncbi:MAG TPA: hypothetical protein VNJ08_17770 [Bacteriovoracaceae bacterium]|nr:hypothetical protein [Bacteriovoracaceae bacterium]
MEKKKDPDTKIYPKKKPYNKPEIQSEKLNSYGALCNGTTLAGRKASTTAPSFCNSAKLLS